MTPKGRGVVGVKADQRGCGAGSQDRAHKSSPFSEEAIFFHLPSELKYNHNRHIVLPPVCKGYNSKLADRAGRLGWVVEDFWGGRSTGSCILGSMRTTTQGVVGNCPTGPDIKICD